ncbi:hypothetical protein CM240_0903 [Clostridium bornimense]|uniref:Uncharacterized protein n=1 Tax=Clostridium bornimense TaxID=1216932 RepID=W6S1A2_9CLOT|nr:hypothetical protein [Clostridium bornimense]CDM68067.1 hypothetical protein CM240_0903 [Clostridium bornimense]
MSDNKKQEEKINREYDKVNKEEYDKLSLADDKKRMGKGNPLNQKR